MGKPENGSLIQEIRGTDKSTLAKDSSVPFMHCDPNDLRSKIRFRLFSKEHTLSLPGQGGILNFTVPVCGFPGANFTYPACIIYARLKKTKQRPDRNEQPGGKFADPVTFFFKNPVRIQMPLGLSQRRAELELSPFKTSGRKQVQVIHFFTANWRLPIFYLSPVLSDEETK